MKRLIITLILCFTTLSCFARKEYCTVVLDDAGDGYYLLIDFGYEYVPYYKVDGKQVKVKSTADLLNFMSKLGWEYIPTQKELLFCREVKDDEQKSDQ